MNLSGSVLHICNYARTSYNSDGPLAAHPFGNGMLLASWPHGDLCVIEHQIVVVLHAPARAVHVE